MIRKPPPAKNRLIEFRAWAREISEKARWDKRWKGTSPDLNGQMARAMERAYQQGYEDAQTGGRSFPEKVSDDPSEPVAVPASHLSTLVAGVLQCIGRMQVGPRLGASEIDGVVNVLMLDDQVRAFFHQEKELSDYRRKAPDWQLRYIRGTEGVDREVRAYGTPISDRTVQLAVRAGLLEEGVNDSPETRDETFLILSPKGRETYLALNGYL
jgi:hypothetical protein